jgi:hypothetical protein
MHSDATGVLVLARRYEEVAVLKRQILSGEIQHTPLIEAPIIESWLRSARKYRIPLEQTCTSPMETWSSQQDWDTTTLYQAFLPSQERISQLIQQGELMVGLSDHMGRLLWVNANPALIPIMERCNIAPGGYWDEASVGTNSIGLALLLRRPVVVFAGEHYLSLLQDWAGYAAPILHPQTGVLEGCIHIGMYWKRHTALAGLAASSLAEEIGRRLPRHLPNAELEIYALGEPPLVNFRGKALRLSPRMLEMLCILAMHKNGLSLEAFHAALYGDETVSQTTLKAELSHLRTLLDGRLGSRPYRLRTSVWADFIELWDAIRQGNVENARKLYRGLLLPSSASPEISEWRNCVNVVMAWNGVRV